MSDPYQMGRAAFASGVAPVSPFITEASTLQWLNGYAHAAHEWRKRQYATREDPDERLAALNEPGRYKAP